MVLLCNSGDDITNMRAIEFGYYGEAFSTTSKPLQHCKKSKNRRRFLLFTFLTRKLAFGTLFGSGKRPHLPKKTEDRNSGPTVK